MGNEKLIKFNYPLGLYKRVIGKYIASVYRLELY